jgi:hypothetical protein
MLGVLRDNSWLLLGVLVVLNVLSVADWAFTLEAFKYGAVEGNPVLAALIEVSPMSAAVFKLLVILAVSLAIWAGRRYRLVLATALLALFLYAGLIAYHIGGLTAVAAGL